VGASDAGAGFFDPRKDETPRGDINPNETMNIRRNFYVVLLEYNYATFKAAKNAIKESETQR